MGAGGGASAWLELDTMLYYRDQNQIQTLSVLGGCLVVGYDTMTEEYKVSVLLGGRMQL